MNVNEVVWAERRDKAIKGLVTVIMPAFNAESTIRQSIESVLRQTYADIELIVVDDGSTDGTAEIVKEFLPTVLYLFQANSGSCAAPRNHGLKHGRGEFVAFLDADDLYLPEHIHRQVDFLAEHPEVGLVFSDYRNFGSSGPSTATHFDTCENLSRQLDGQRDLVLREPLLMLTEANFGSACSFLMRRVLLELVPGFDEELRACEDFHFYFRVARQTRVAVVNEVGMLRRLHSQNMSRDKDRMVRAALLACRKLYVTESDSRARLGLRLLLLNDWHNRGRLEANEGHFFRSCAYYLRGLWLGVNLRTLRETIVGIIRAGAISVRLHSPRDLA